MVKKVSVSFLSCEDKEEGLFKIDHTDADYVHVDEMDGHFVPNKNHSYHELKKFCSYSSKKLDVHLMVANPKHFIEKYAALNTEMITIHLEIEEDLSSLLNLIHSYGIKAGLAISPDTNLSFLDPYFEEIDSILLMSVYPGKGGQPFLSDTVERLKVLKEKVVSSHRNILLSVDGGIKADERPLLENADIIVSGSYITTSEDYQEKIDTLR